MQLWNKLTQNNVGFKHQFLPLVRYDFERLSFKSNSNILCKNFNYSVNFQFILKKLCMTLKKECVCLLMIVCVFRVCCCPRFFFSRWSAVSPESQFITVLSIVALVSYASSRTSDVEGQIKVLERQITDFSSQVLSHPPCRLTSAPH